MMPSQIEWNRHTCKVYNLINIALANITSRLQCDLNKANSKEFDCDVKHKDTTNRLRKEHQNEELGSTAFLEKMKE